MDSKLSSGRLRQTCGAGAWALALAIAAGSAWAETPAPATPAPALSLKDASGANVDLAQFKGQVVYLDFWASWCGPCRQSFPWMNDMQAKYGPKGLQVLGVNVDSQSPEAQAFLKDVHAHFRVVFDPQGKTPAAFGVKGMPTSYLIDRQGRVVMSHMGFNRAGASEVEHAIQQQLEAK